MVAWNTRGSLRKKEGENGYLHHDVQELKQVGFRNFCWGG
jgi:hypothetical protein